MKNFLIELKNSVYGPKYYEGVLAQPLKESFKYYLKLSLFLALFCSIAGTVFVAPEARNLLNNGIKEFLSNFPNDLNIKIEGGKISTDSPIPYFYPIPQSIKESIIVQGFDLENLFILDTVNDFSVDQFIKYKTLFLITSHNIAYIDESGSIKIISIDGLPNYVLNKSSIVGLADNIQTFLKYIYPVLVLAYFLVALGFMTFFLASNAIMTLPLWVIFKMKGYNMNYPSIFQAGLHLLTLPVIISFVFLFLPYYKTPLLTVAIFFLLAIFNLKKAEKPIV